MCCLHTTVQGRYFASTNRLSTINRSPYPSGTTDHRGTCGETLCASPRVLFMLHLAPSYSTVYAACSNIYNFNNTARSISLHLQTAFLTSRFCVRVALIKPATICKAPNYNPQSISTTQLNTTVVTINSIALTQVHEASTQCVCLVIYITAHLQFHFCQLD